MMSPRPTLFAKFLGLCLVLSALAAFPSSGAAAVIPAPAWKVEPSIQPSQLEPGSSAAHYAVYGSGAAKLSTPKLRVFAYNVGGASFGETVVTDLLPEGLVSTPGIEPEWYAANPATPEQIENEGGRNEVSGQCTVVGPARREVICDVPSQVLPASSLQVYIPLDVNVSEATTLTNEVTVEGSGGPTAYRRTPVAIGQPDLEFAFPPNEEEGVGGLASDEAGQSPLAGTHPFLVEVTSKVTTKVLAAGTNYSEARPAEALRSVNVSLPSGVVVDPRATPVRCTKKDFALGENFCPVGSQVGVIYFDLLSDIEGAREPIYNLVPEPGVPAELGFAVQGATVTVRGGLSGDFRLTAGSSEILARFPINGVRVQLWGVPSDPRHDYARRSIVPTERCEVGCGTSPDLAPFLTMPSACSPSMEFDVRATSWEEGSKASRPEVFRTVGGEPEVVEGCEELGFEPKASVEATTDAPDAPTGLGVTLTIPQHEGLEERAAATLKKVSVQLPPGMAVNPPAANGLGACSQAQIGVGNNSPASCPNASKVGTAEVVTPLLESPLKGSVYLAEQKYNPFGTLLALYLAVEGEGVVIKLPGRVDADPQTGRLTATFDDNPQLPFESLNVELNGGPRATLVTPPSCGTYGTRTEFTSWASSTPVVVYSPMTINQGCSTGGFSPTLTAGTTNPVAGSYSSFTLRVTREDGEQDLSKINASLPDGLLAKLAGVPLCPEAQTGSGNCPAASQLGTTITGVGAGTQPLYIPQAGKSPTAVYLAGPYKGAPYSLVVKVPAQAGPFDLGTIAVRVALNVDPYTAQVTASSDPLPQILEGIPVAYRDVRVEITRPEFVLNPTSCEPMAVTSSIASVTGAIAAPSSRFQVGGCSGLAFKPSLKVSLKGSTKRTGHPALKAVVTYPSKGAYANIARAQVNLPHSVFLDQGNLNNTCTKPVLEAGNCPKSSVYGKAKAWTPLLEKPLEGNVYLVGGFGYKLPALVADLGGQLRVLLKSKVDSGPNKGIRDTFETIPDAPVSRFVLEMKGGKKYSLLENSENLCHKPQRAIARFTGQNGAVEQLHPLIASQCGKKNHGGGKSGSSAKNGKRNN